MASDKLKACGRDWCVTKKYQPERSVLLIGKETNIQTLEIVKQLALFFTVEEVSRVEEEDSYRWLEKLVLVHLVVASADQVPARNNWSEIWRISDWL